MKRALMVATLLGLAVVVSPVPASGADGSSSSSLTPVTDLETHPFDDRGLNVFWTDHDHDATDFVVDWGRGTAVPPYDDSPSHVTDDSLMQVLDQLATNAVYTFAVYERDGSGGVSEPRFVRASTRYEGLWVATDDRAGLDARNHIWSANEAAAAMEADGHLRLVFSDTRVQYASRKPKKSFEYPYFDIAEGGNRQPALAATATNELLAAWESRRGVRYRFRTNRSDGWTGAHPLTKRRSDELLGATYDGRHPHVLLRRSGDEAGLWWFSHNSSGWDGTRIAGTRGRDTGAVTQDRRSGKVVVAIGHTTAAGDRVQVAVVSPAASHIRGLTTWAVAPDLDVDLDVTSVASVGGEVTVALQQATRPLGTADDGPYLVRGTAHDHGSMLRVRGTTAKDRDVVVTALQANHAVFSWRRTSGSWSPEALGIWVSQSVHRRDGWHQTAPDRWTESAYDTPTAAFRSDAGHLYVVFITSGEDVTE